MLNSILIHTYSDMTFLVFYIMWIALMPYYMIDNNFIKSIHDKPELIIAIRTIENDL